MKEIFRCSMLACALLVGGCNEGDDTSQKALKALSEETCSNPGNSQVVAYTGSEYLDQSKSTYNNSFHVVEWVGRVDTAGDVVIQRKSCGAEKCNVYETLKLAPQADGLPDYVSFRIAASSHSNLIDDCYKDVLVSIQDWDVNGIISGTIGGSYRPEGRPKIFWVDMNQSSEN
jgi:hypothetical protein